MARAYGEPAVHPVMRLIAFKPGDGAKFRETFEKKHGPKGRDLIDSLGRGSYKTAAKDSEADTWPVSVEGGVFRCFPPPVFVRPEGNLGRVLTTLLLCFRRRPATNPRRSRIPRNIYGPGDGTTRNAQTDENEKKRCRAKTSGTVFLIIFSTCTPQYVLF